jgi:hypothetical protein
MNNSKHGVGVNNLKECKRTLCSAFECKHGHNIHFLAFASVAKDLSAYLVCLGVCMYPLGSHQTNLCEI